MFKRILVEDWALWLPMVSFIIFGTVFVAVSLKALCLGKTERSRLAALPLDDSPPQSPTPSESR